MKNYIIAGLCILTLIMVVVAYHLGANLKCTDITRDENHSMICDNQRVLQGRKDPFSPVIEHWIYRTN